nr:hypothetical protein [Pandoravirus massiliensis]
MHRVRWNVVDTGAMCSLYLMAPESVSQGDKRPRGSAVCRRVQLPLWLQNKGRCNGGVLLQKKKKEEDHTITKRSPGLAPRAQVRNHPFSPYFLLKEGILCTRRNGLAVVV